MIDKIVDFQIKYSKFLLVGIVLLTLFSANIAKDILIEPDFGVLIPDESEYNTNDVKLQRAFSNTGAVIVLLSLDDTTTLDSALRSINDDRVDLYFKELSQVMLESQFVLSTSPVTYAQDLQSAQIVVTIQEPERIAGLSEVTKELNELVDEVGKPVGTQVTITGFAVLIDRIPTLLIEDNLRTIAITILFVIAILYWYSRDIYFTFVTTLIPVLSIIYLGAMMVTLGIPITITLAAVGVLVLGLGVDYAIHISVHYSKEIQNGKSHRDALIHTLEVLLLPVTASFTTTLSGFAALIFGVAPSSHAQGIVLTMTIAIIYTVTLTFFPILMTQFSRHMKVKPNKVINVVVDGLARLAAFQVKYPKIIIFIVFLITIVMMVGASQVKFSTSNSNWIPDGDEVSQSFRELENSYGGNPTPLSILIEAKEGDLRDIEKIRDIEVLLQRLEYLDSIDSVNSPYDFLRSEDSMTYSEMYDDLTLNVAGDFNSDYTITRITIVTRNLESDDAGKSILLKEVRDILSYTSIQGVEVSMYGDAVRFDELGDTLQQDAGITTGVGLMLVFIVASIMYVSIRVGFLALLPIIIAVIWAVGLMGYLKVPFTSLSTGIISLVLGIGVDFSIHLVDGIRRYSKTMTLNRAVYKTMTVSGKAILLASLTTCVGFFALTFAQLLGTQRLGFSLVFSIISVLFVSILLVPSVMSLRMNKSKKSVN